MWNNSTTEPARSVLISRWVEYFPNALFSWLLVFLLGTVRLVAQEGIDTTETLQEVEISVTKSILRTSNLSASSHDLTKLITPGYSINELTNRIAGMFTTAATNFAQDSRISSRGFGARSAFGIRGIRIITDDFPDTSPDGQSQLDNIDFNSLKNIEFLRGPQSGLYGNNSGGVLNLKSFDFNEENITTIGITYGSYGLKTGRISSVFGHKKFKSNTGIVHTDYAGYRTWSQFKNTVFNSVNEYRSGRHQVKMLLNYAYSPQGNDPGGVNLTELANGRQLARPANELFKAGETVSQYKAGLKYALKKEDNSEQFTFRSYGIIRDFTNNLPFENNGAVTINRLLYGINTDYNLRYEWNGIKIGQKLGLETEYQNDLRKQFQNLKTNRGDEKFNQNEIFRSTSLYLLNELKFNNNFSITFNLRNDNINTEAQDNFLSNGNQSGNAKNSAYNYCLALNYFDKIHKYSFINSTGFENPTLSELSNNPAGLGGFSSSLQPMKSTNFELSISSRNIDKWKYNVSAYHITTSDEIIGYEVTGQTGRTFFRNQGQTTRQGIEASTNISLYKHLGISYQHNYIIAKYSDSTAFMGKKLPGIPHQVIQIGIDFDLGFKTVVQIENRYVGNIYLNDSNVDLSKRYNELNLKGKKIFTLENKSLTITAGVSNLLNSEYFSNFRINAAGGRYYETALPRNFYISGQIQF